ncbi:hypothetical protein QUC30_16420 [Aeromonas caviae]|uniref:hypothetical protein n=1 Tax=Aeromonas caviae TaxID=648 RepID=UPI003D2EF2C4
MDLSGLPQSILSDLIAALIVAALAAIAAKISYAWARQAASSAAPYLLVFAVVAIATFLVGQGVDFVQSRTDKGRLQAAVDSMLMTKHSAYLKDGWTIEVYQLEPQLILNFGYPDSLDAHTLHHPLNTESLRLRVRQIALDQRLKQEPRFGFTLHTFSQDEYNRWASKRVP